MYEQVMLIVLLASSSTVLLFPKISPLITMKLIIGTATAHATIMSTEVAIRIFTLRDSSFDLQVMKLRHDAILAAMYHIFSPKHQDIMRPENSLL